MENLALSLALVVAIAGLLVAVRWWVIGPAVTRRKEGLIKAAATAEQLLEAIDDDDDETPVEDRLKALERSLRMLTGRVNKLAPPRLGTGQGVLDLTGGQGQTVHRRGPNGDEHLIDPGQELGRPLTRAELYAQTLRRRRHAR